MWSIDESNFEYHKSTKQYSYRIDNKPKVELDKTPIGDLSNAIFQTNPERNITTMDSLIQIGKSEAISPMLLKTLGIYYDRDQYRNLVSCFAIGLFRMCRSQHTPHFIIIWVWHCRILEIMRRV